MPSASSNFAAPYSEIWPGMTPILSICPGSPISWRVTSFT